MTMRSFARGCGRSWIVQPSIEVVGEAEHGEQAVRAADRVRPDVVLMDLEMPGLNGIEATRRIVESHPDAKIVVLTSHAAEEDVFPALKLAVYPAGRVEGLAPPARSAVPKDANHAWQKDVKQAAA